MGRKFHSEPKQGWRTSRCRRRPRRLSSRPRRQVEPAKSVRLRVVYDSEDRVERKRLLLEVSEASRALAAEVCLHGCAVRASEDRW